MNETETKRRITAEIESCDCGSEYPCSHGPWLNGVRLDEPRPEVADRYSGKDEPIPDYAYSYSEVCEFPAWLATMLLLAPELTETLRRCVESLDDLVRSHTDPGTEALAALDCARAALRKLDRDPVDLAWEPTVAEGSAS